MVGEPFDVDADYFLTLMTRERQMWNRSSLTDRERAKIKKAFGTGTARVWWRKFDREAVNPRYVLTPVA